MLILSRKVGEAIVIDNEITVRLLEVKGGQVKLGVEAPSRVRVHREEVYRSILDENRRAALEAPTDPAALAYTLPGSAWPGPGEDGLLLGVADKAGDDKENGE